MARTHLTSLKVAILESGFTQYEVAARLGLTETRLSRMVRGRDPIPAEVREQLADVLGVGESLLFPDADSTPATRADAEGIGNAA